MESVSSDTTPRNNFISEMVADDVATNRFGRPVTTRFPPEPNGFPHIGHAKSVCLNFGIAEEFGGRCNLRFDDTNPFTEDIKYVEAIKRDVEWLGFTWDAELYASDYFEPLYEIAEELVKAGRRTSIRRPRRRSARTAGRSRRLACQARIAIARRREPGPAAPHAAGEFPDGAHVLRAKIDLAHPEHDHARSAAAAYPPCVALPSRRRRGASIRCTTSRTAEDAIEGITHSLCTLEFKDNRDIYDWLVREAGFERPPEQTEFARLELDYTVLSKRKLLRLVNEGHVCGWDDPRMPTIAGLRRRGVTPEAMRDFCERSASRASPRAPSSRRSSTHPRRPQHARAARDGVLDPLKVVLTNYPEGQVDELDASYYPHDVPLTGSRKVPFSRELWIERDDFMEDPPKKFFRLAPGREVRLRYGYFITCTDVVKNAAGKVVELRCTYDPATRGGDAPDGRKVRARSTGCRGARRSTARCGSTTSCSPYRTPRGRAKTRTSRRALNPDSLRRRVRMRRWSRACAATRRDHATSSSARATSSSDDGRLERRASWCSTGR